MTLEDFTTSLEQELRLRGVRFDRADLLDFAADVWPLAQDDPDVARWAQAFIDRGEVDITV